MTPLANNPVLQALAARQRLCPLGKTRYATRKDALSKLAQLTERMNAFRCGVCEGYHLGHRRGQV